MAIKKEAKKTNTRKAQLTERSERNTRVSEDQIRVRAYELHLTRGESPGDAMSDWLQAERELHKQKP